MEITSVKRTVSFGNFENISMESKVKEGEDVSTVLMELECKIEEEIRKRKENYELQFKINNQQYKLDRLKNEVETFEKRKDGLLKWAEKHKISANVINDLPF